MIVVSSWVLGIILAACPIQSQGVSQIPPDKSKLPAAQDAPSQAPSPEEKDTHPPAVSGGTPTVTDAAEMSAPGWIEFDPGVLKDLDHDTLLGSPFTFKFTTTNNRLQYLLGFDGLVLPTPDTVFFGDSYPGLHYLFLEQQKHGFDVALKGIVKVPTAPISDGGTGRPDYSGYLLASRDFTKWGFHGDFNLGALSLSRQDAPGYDTQAMISGSTTTPIPGGRWQYTNEVVYFTGIEGAEPHVSMMHGVSYAAHRYATYSAALQFGLHGDLPHYQLLFAASFNIAGFGGK